MPPGALGAVAATGAAAGGAAGAVAATGGAAALPAGAVAIGAAAATWYRVIHSPIWPRRLWLGMTRLSVSGSPVRGDVACVRSHCSTPAREYV